MITYDDVLIELGELGRFQLTIYFLICLPTLFCGANNLLYVFTAGASDYRCFVPGCDSNSSKFDEPWVQNAIPHKDRSKSNQNFEASQCEMFKRVSDGCTNESFSEEVVKCDQWVFGDEYTIIQEWKLTCPENQLKIALVGNIHFLGILIGTFIFGILCDRFGRKYLYLVAILTMSLTGLAHVSCSNYHHFLAVTFFHAIGTSGVFPTGFVLGVELVGRKRREFTGVALNFFYAVGEAILGVIAYYFKDWKLIMIVMTTPCIVFMVYCCYIPESIRWLLALNQTREASRIIYQAAKINRVELSSRITSVLNKPPPMDIDEEAEEQTPIWPVIKQICKTKALVYRYLIVFFLWCTNAFIYYGMSLNSTGLVGNKYINFILVCLIEIPGYLLAWFVLFKVGRKYSLIAALFICSFLCTMSIFIPTNMEWIIICLFLTGKLCITCSYGIIYIYTAELFPTIVRSGGVSTSSMFARLGALLAPFLPLLDNFWKPLSMVLFASIATLAAILCFKLPETLKRKLPETVEDVLNISNALDEDN